MASKGLLFSSLRATAGAWQTFSQAGLAEGSEEPGLIQRTRVSAMWLFLSKPSASLVKTLTKDGPGLATIGYRSRPGPPIRGIARKWRSDMRIQDRSSLGPTTPQTGRAGETQKSGRDNGARTGATGSADGDRVELSSTLGRLSEAISAHGVQRANRVQALATDYQTGRFQPNSQGTSRAMIGEALSAHG